MQTADKELIDATLAGKREAFGQLVQRYQDRLFHSMLQIVRSHEAAEDTVQEAFLRAYKGLGSFQRQSSFYTWLYRIALNLVLTQRRRVRPERPLDGAWEDPSGEPSDLGQQPGDRLVRQERMAQIQDALAKLDQDQRAVLVLRAIEGYDYQTIARVLGLSVGTVRSRLHRARARVRDYLEAML
jgi:RNA polymerase sigma-70 factor (ECF subfamily)